MNYIEITKIDLVNTYMFIIVIQRFCPMDNQREFKGPVRRIIPFSHIRHQNSDISV